MGQVIGYDFVKKECKVCHNIRTFLRGTPRDEMSVCGNCWPWPKIKASEDELSKVREMLSYANKGQSS